MRKMEESDTPAAALRLVATISTLIPLLLSVACSESDQDPHNPDSPSPAIASIGSEWSPAERAIIDSLSIASLPPTPDSPSNRVADDANASRLGHQLFFDAGLSRDGSVACATCHRPDLRFTDGRPTSRGIGNTPRNAPSLIGSAHSPWLYWDGRRDSLWSQALAPFEAAAEMGSTRLAVVRRVTSEPATRELYRETFGSVPNFENRDRYPESAGPYGDVNEKAAWARLSATERRAIDQAFANIGKAIAAYERLLEPGPSRFDRYVETLGGDSSQTDPVELSELEVEGLRLFIDETRSLCLRCHNGPLLTNQSFHHVGTASNISGIPDFGRFLGVQSVLIDPFNCLGAYSDTMPENCGEIRFLDKSHVASATGQFKTPTLRGLAETAPYMHDGRFATMAEVIQHYREPGANTDGRSELIPLDITDREVDALVAFLATLDGEIATARRWLEPPRAGRK